MTETINAKAAIKQIAIAGLGIFIVVVPYEQRASATCHFLGEAAHDASAIL